LNQISTKRLSKLTTNVITQSKKYCPIATNDVLNKLTIDGAEELKNQIYRAKKYQCIRITQDSWKVTRCSTSFKELEKKIIPMFKIVNTVKLCNNNRLQCDCSYNQVWGIPCVHSLSVANTFISDKWNGISHNDVSVVWWKSYYLYSLPEKVDINKNKQEKIKQIFHMLREKEKMGITIPVEVFDNLETEIVPIEQLPELFKEPPPHVVMCYNYPNSDKMHDFDPFALILDGSMTQLTENEVQLTLPDEEDLFMYVNQNLEESSNENHKSGSFYSQMLPSFREASNWVMAEEDVSTFNEMISKFVGKMKTKHRGDNSSSNDSNHVYISSNVPCEKAKSHHGCDGWRSNNH